ncbi:hypothetical protein ACFSKL_06900 [Belliella marina]|uniref:Uncharacterized protein n=1 Tax=Belliella marina TaxID=1644146 RepID=A0ABW4VIH8_9BACT
MAMGNDPISNIDPDGEFFFGTLLSPISGIARGITRVAQGDGIGGFFKGFGEGVWNGIKIDAGKFAWDKNLGVGKNLLAIGSRLTWEAPQQFVGNLYNAAHNVTGQVDWVRFKYGATVVSSGIQPGGISLGSYITGRSGAIQADENNWLFQHEYGHVLQSRSLGLAYLGRVGLPSLFDNDAYGSHDLHPVEQDANLKAFLYFNKHIRGFYESPSDSGQPNAYKPNDGRGWNFTRNPLDPNRTGRRGQYWDYRNQSHLQTLSSLRVRARWYDYAFPLSSGIYNTIRYNNP